MRGMRNAYNILIGKPEGQRPLGRCRWEINMRIDLREIGRQFLDWTHLSQDRDK
jgi:hypothetical protein